MSHLIIIGGGHAAAHIIAGLHKQKYPGRITMVSSEDVLPCNRPLLSKAYLNNEIDADQLALLPVDIWQSAQLSYRLHTRVTRIEPASHRIQLDDGSCLSYDQLVLATGTTPRQLTLPGHELKGIHYLKTRADAESLRAALVPSQKLTLIGGGYIGLEIASAARKHGLEVCLLEAAERILGRVVAPEVSEYYAQLHREQGVNIETNVQIQGFEGDGQVRAVSLSDGRAVDTDLVVVGIGVQPSDQLARDAGLACDNGICVDAQSRTSDPHIFAAGDCASQYHPLYKRPLRLESVPSSNLQAQTVVAALTGGTPDKQPEVPWFWSTQYDYRLQIAGLSQDYDQLIRRGDSDQACSWLYLQEGRLIACDAINRPADFLQAKKLISSAQALDCGQLPDTDIPLSRCIA